ncbi:hypothetical protein EST38_g13790 [Candolleomyces aberdarensis]|uniref:Uncharacterized protein n=1 Tax=Candolleomyces aberdarensis TaxID=2316362 RepID=A0A4Q2D0W4_9AGAR|nr:hypothetical protein EST38_g13790 [Candolleomyces aberdarensis]
MLQVTLARQDAELCAHFLVHQATAVHINKLHKQMERHEYRRLCNFHHPLSPDVTVSTCIHNTSVPTTRGHIVPTSSSKKSVKEWKEGKEKEKTSKVQAAPAKPSKAAAETSTSKSPTKGKEAAPKTKSKSTKEAAAPEVKEKPKTRATSQAEGLKTKAKHCATPKLKETISREEGEEGETIEKDEDVEIQEVDAEGEEVDEDIPINQQDEEDKDSD